jgi:hypothetical protein
VRALGLVELERSGEGVEHAVGDAGGVSALEARVVVGADPGEQRDLFAAQAGDAAVFAVDGKTDLVGCDLRAAGGEELADLGSGIHTGSVPRLNQAWGVLSVPGSTGTPTPGESVLS